MNREIIRTAKDVVNVEENDKELEITHVYYPLAPYGNHVTTGIVFYKNDNKIKVYRVRQDWNGTGSDQMAYVELDEDEFQQLIDTARKIKDVDDFNLLTNKIKHTQEKIDTEIDDKLSEVVDALKQLQLSAKLRALLNDQAEVLEALELYVEE